MRGFQREAQKAGLLPQDVPGQPRQIGNDPGPKTRAALHQALVRLTVPVERADDAQVAPVVEEKPVAVTPPALDKPVMQTSGFWERGVTIAGSIGISGASWFGDWRVILAIAGAITVVALLGLLLHARIIAAVKEIKAAVAMLRIGQLKAALRPVRVLWPTGSRLNSLDPENFAAHGLAFSPA